MANTTPPSTPQCSAANPGPLADANGGESELKRALEALFEAEERTLQALVDSYDAERAARQARDRYLAWQREHGREGGITLGEINLQGAAQAAERRAREALLRFHEAFNNEIYHRRNYEEVQARHDTPIDPTGQDLPGTGGEDPRCEGRRRAAAWGAPWSDICRGDDGHLVDFKECRRRMTDRIYAASGGRCWTEPGPDDATRTVCRDDTPSGGNAGSTPPCDNTEPGKCLNEPDLRRVTPSGRGSIGPVPNPIKPFLEQMCNNGRCPDPSPFDGPIDGGANGNAGSSNMRAPEAGPSACPGKKRGQACAGTMMPRQAAPGQALRSRDLRLTPPSATRQLQHGLPRAGGQQGIMRSNQTPSYGQGPRLRQFGPAPTLRTHLPQQSPEISRSLQRTTKVLRLNSVKPSNR